MGLKNELEKVNVEWADPLMLGFEKGNGNRRWGLSNNNVSNFSVLLLLSLCGVGSILYGELFQCLKKTIKEDSFDETGKFPKE